MPAQIVMAKVLDEHVKQIPVRSVSKSMFILAAAPDMWAIIKLAMIASRSKFIKLITDSEILDVYLGKKARQVKGSDVIERVGDIYNSLQELMEPPDLAIIWLNKIGYKNKAAAEVLEEAVCYRIDQEKPTWLFSDLDKPFVESSKAYSESLMYYIKSTMPTVRIPRILPRMTLDSSLNPDPLPHQTTTDNGPKVQNRLVQSEPARDSEKKPRPKIQSAPDEGDLLPEYGTGLGPKKQFRRSH